MASGLEWHVTGLWYPGDALDDIVYVGRVADPQDAQITIPLNDSRRASVTLPILSESTLAQAIYRSNGVYCCALKAYYNGQLVFWGPVNLLTVDMAAGTMQVSAVDPSIRLIHHYFRRGDLNPGVDSTAILSAANGDRGWTTVDGDGMRLLRDAGINTLGQTANGDPDLGIIDGTDDFGAPVGLMGIDRGMQVWSTMIQMAQTGGPDFELEPIEDTAGAYAQLNTYTKQGTDKTATVAFHYGTGKQNLDNLQFVDGSAYVTHVHVLTADGKYRFTEANTGAARFSGVYVQWDAVDWDAGNVDPDSIESALREHGREVLRSIGEPLIQVTLTLPQDTTGSYKFGTDFGVGDLVGVQGRVGVLDLGTEDWRITAVRLGQANHDNGVQTEIDVVADRVGDTAFAGGEE